MAWRKKSTDHIGRRLRMLRADAGLTVGDVARGLKVSRSQVRRWEKGKEPIPEGARRAIADVLRVPVADLVPTREQSQVEVQQSTLRVGAVERPIPAADPDAVLPGYLEMVYMLRGLEPGAPLPLRDEDLDALAVALGSDPDVIEGRLLELITCSEEEAARLRALILRRRMASSAAGLAAGALALSGLSFDELFDDPPPQEERLEVVSDAGDGDPAATVGSSTTVAPPPVAEPDPEPAPAPVTQDPEPAPTTETTVNIGDPLVIERPPPGSEPESQDPEVGEGRTIERDPPGSETTEPQPESDPEPESDPTSDPAVESSPPPVDDSTPGSDADPSTDSSTAGDPPAEPPVGPPVDVEAPVEPGPPVDVEAPVEPGPPVDVEPPVEPGPPVDVEPPVEPGPPGDDGSDPEVVPTTGVTLQFSHGGAPLSGAVVLVQEVGGTGWTNLGKTGSDGSLVAPDLAPGSYVVRANLHGMEVVDTITFEPGATVGISTL